MQAFFDGEQIGLEKIELDDLGWDHASSIGNNHLTIELTKEDRLTLGCELHMLAQEYCVEEPSYFEDEYMEDVPIPTSQQIFVENPDFFTTYFESSFWRRELILALMKQIDFLCVQPKDPQYWIQDFRGTTLEHEKVFLKFEIYIKQS